MVVPGGAVEVLAAAVMVSVGMRTGTLTEHLGSVPPAGQSLPGAVVVIVLARTLFPVSGLLTVTVPVTVIVPPTGMLPVQEMPVAVSDSVPEVAVWSPLGVASSTTSVMFEATVIPV